jgi:hypothetical protein
MTEKDSARVKTRVTGLGWVSCVNGLKISTHGSKSPVNQEPGPGLLFVGSRAALSISDNVMICAEEIKKKWK